MTKKMGLTKSIFSFSISSWINIIIGFAYTILSTRLLLPDTYGMVSIFMSAVNTLMYVVCLGLDASFIRFFNERPNNEKKNIFSYKLILVVSINILIVFFISTVFLFDWFNNFMFGRLSWLLTILLYVSVYSNLLLRFFNIIYRMSFNIKKYTIQNVIIQSGMKGLTLVAAFINPSYEMIITFQVIGILVITLFYVYVQRKDIFPIDDRGKLVKIRIDYKGYSPVIRYAIFSAPLYISTNLNVLLTQQVLKISLGTTALGIYAAVNVFSTLYGAVQNGFSTFWSAYVYKNYKEEHSKISTMTDYVFLVAIISLSGFVLFRKILYLFIGSEYQSSITFFSMVLMCTLFNLLAQATIYGIDLAKKNYITAITNCVYVIINAMAVYISALKWGLIGVGFAVMITRMILFLINTFISQKFYKTIQSKCRFFFGLCMLTIIAISPALPIKEIYSYFLVIVILVLSLFIYKAQYKLAFNTIMSKFRSNR